MDGLRVAESVGMKGNVKAKTTVSMMVEMLDMNEVAAMVVM